MVVGWFDLGQIGAPQPTRRSGRASLAPPEGTDGE